MKYYIAPTGKIEEGPGGTPLSFVLKKELVTEIEFTKVIDDFFELHTTDDLQPKAKESKELAWEYLRQGKTVTIEDKTLSIKING